MTDKTWEERNTKIIEACLFACLLPYLIICCGEWNKDSLYSKKILYQLVSFLEVQNNLWNLGIYLSPWNVCIIIWILSIEPPKEAKDWYTHMEFKSLGR